MSRPLLPFDRIAKTVPMLGAAGEAEKLAAVHALDRILRGAGANFVDLGDATGALGRRPPIGISGQSQQPCQDWRGLVRWAALYGAGILNDRDMAFIEGLASRPPRALSLRQRDWLADIADRLSMRRSA